MILLNVRDKTISIKSDDICSRSHKARLYGSDYYYHFSVYAFWDKCIQVYIAFGLGKYSWILLLHLFRFHSLGQLKFQFFLSVCWVSWISSDSWISSLFSLTFGIHTHTFNHNEIQVVWLFSQYLPFSLMWCSQWTFVVRFQEP